MYLQPITFVGDGKKMSPILILTSYPPLNKANFGVWIEVSLTFAGKGGRISVNVRCCNYTAAVALIP